MRENYTQVLQARLDSESYARLAALRNPKLHRFIAEYVDLCNPASVFVATDSAADIGYVRNLALQRGAERPLAMEGHTVHFDGPKDQGRDKENTRYLVPAGLDLGERLNSMPRQQGVEEVRAQLRGIMTGKLMIVRFFCLGPVGSEFAIHCVQLTDSSYVAHSEDLLYRQGYGAFAALGDSEGFFRFVHSSGELRDGVSANPEKRRVYIDLEEDLVYSVNTQYAGNTVGFKKLALRLAIRKADREGWLAEHMLLMGVNGPGGRRTYFAGAFPSYCGKTSTAMLPGETIVGDDLTYLRIKDGVAHGVNVESGIFGVIQGVNSQDDPVIWDALNTPGELIFSNVLVTPDRVPYWTGKDGECPPQGVNFSGEWFPGKIDEDGEEIPPSHKNARFTFSLRRLANCDLRLDDPQGVRVAGLIYGGRDTDTWVPVEEALDWTHGIITKAASLESETTAATLGAEGVRKFDLMAILDFLAIPLGRYVQNNLDFGHRASTPPLIFGVNYFLKAGDGRYLNHVLDKHVWVKWMELRAHGDAGAIRTPTGYIPLYETLKELFPQVVDREYGEDAYVQQFSTRVPQHVRKLDRIEHVYRSQVADTPPVLFEVLRAQRQRLEDARAKHGDVIAPDKY
jgi:phosphoenolpyruvate carboxykinase (GTP)